MTDHEKHMTNMAAFS